MGTSFLGFEVFNHRLTWSRDSHSCGPFAQLVPLVSTSLGGLTAASVQISVQLAVRRSHGGLRLSLPGTYNIMGRRPDPH